MKNTNTSSSVNTNETAADNAIKTVDLIAQQQALAAADAVKSDDVVAEVLNKGKLKGVKSSLRQRDWINIVGAGVIAGVASTADMIVTNKLQIRLHGDDAEQYSPLQIAGVAAATTLVASTLRAAVDFIPKVNTYSDAGLIATSLVSNGTFVASAYVRDAAMNMLKGRMSVDIEALAEEA